MAKDEPRWNSTRKQDAVNARAREIKNAVHEATTKIQAENDRLNNENDRLNNDLIRLKGVLDSIRENDRLDKVRLSIVSMRSIAGCGKSAQVKDPVNHPPHYTSGGVEVIDAIEAWGLGFNTGNAVKYVARAGKKDPTKTLEDLAKAKWYIEREIARLGKP